MSCRTGTLNSAALVNPQLLAFLREMDCDLETLEAEVDEIITVGAPVAMADFFALMPGDNAATVAIGGAVDFPQNGQNTSGTGITRFGASVDQFQLALPGIYRIDWQVSVTEPGQLLVGMDGVNGITEQLYTTSGRAGLTDQVVGMVTIVTTLPNSIVTIRNPAANAVALTITPSAGGTLSVSAHLLITLLAVTPLGIDVLPHGPRRFGLDR